MTTPNIKFIESTQNVDINTNLAMFGKVYTPLSGKPLDVNLPGGIVAQSIAMRDFEAYQDIYVFKTPILGRCVYFCSDSRLSKLELAMAVGNYLEQRRLEHGR